MLACVSQVAHLWAFCFCSVALSCLLSGQTAYVARAVAGLLRAMEERVVLDLRLRMRVSLEAFHAPWKAGCSAASRAVPAFVGRAQHGHVADAALRPQDRGVFEAWIQPDTHPDLDGGAANAQTVGPSISACFVTTQFC